MLSIGETYTPNLTSLERGHLWLLTTFLSYIRPWYDHDVSKFLDVFLANRG